ncbi:GGDEF domain-containing protein [Methylocaldum sp.]|uniref:GGDEF domain-containing protein n=1 Tax=Methylocaldum sp. TaxID=1969727 RepID=UPI002D299DE1|nr:GGDEF domain-containing protein [Methylocaldum sp.]HYE33932.1 GGDEF domain-containing protein [Methylocaldum sp.]
MTNIEELLGKNRLCLHDPQLCRHLSLTLTAQRDQQSLTECLAQWLEQLSLAESFSIYRLIEASQTRGGAHVAIGEWRIEGLFNIPRENSVVAASAVEGVVSCLERGEPVEISRDNGALRYVQPVKDLRSTALLLVFDGFVGNDSAKEFLADLAHLVSNLSLLHMQSERDALTRLLNRQVFNRKLSQIQHDLSLSDRRHMGEDSGYFLALIDVDHFKRINDHYGHLYGDEVLVALADLMEQTFRHTDYLFRYGGEEFAAILSRLNEGQAENALERFRLTVTRKMFPRIGGITLSIGYCRMEPGASSQMIERADKALYFCKNNGRNRVAEFRKLLAQNLVYEPVNVSGLELF